MLGCSVAFTLTQFRTFFNVIVFIQAGYIRVPAGDEYLIEPLKDTKPIKGKEHPHIIYKRSGKKDPHGVSNCLTRGNLYRVNYNPQPYTKFHLGLRL